MTNIISLDIFGYIRGGNTAAPKNEGKQMMCALYSAYRIFAKLSPCDATREVIKEIKKNKQTEVKPNEQEKASNT